MFVPTLEDKGALKSFGNRFLNKYGVYVIFKVYHFSFKEKKRDRKKGNTTRKKKAKQNK